jgi:putative molybdopterin biosynthesis protein
VGTRAARVRKSPAPASVLRRKPAARPDAPAEMMDTREVAAHLRLKSRRIYDLVRDRAIPHVRVTGKLLFPRSEIDQWVARNSSAASGRAGSQRAPSAPPIVAGSHDPLLEWAVREARSGLAILACGSQGGIARLAQSEAVAAAIHWIDPASGEYNVPLVRASFADADDIVVIEWARRTQGLLVAPGNPLRVRSLHDLVKRRARVIARQPEAGSDRLLRHLLDRERIDGNALRWCEQVALAENDLAAIIAAGDADVGLGIEAVAHAAGLDFIPLAQERIDLVARRRDVFEPALQALLAFARTPAFAAHAKRLGGYDVANTGRVVFNA